MLHRAGVTSFGFAQDRLCTLASSRNLRLLLSKIADDVVALAFQSIREYLIVPM